MEPVPLTRISQLIHFSNALEKLGLSTGRVVEKAGLPSWHHHDPDHFLPSRHVFRFMQQAADAAAIDGFGLLVGATGATSRFDADGRVLSLGSLGTAICRAPTVFASLRTACRLLPRHTSISRCHLTMNDDELWYCRQESAAMDVGRDLIEQYTLMQMINTVRLATGPDWYPRMIRLQTHERLWPGARAFLGDAEIDYGQDVTAIAVSRSMLGLPLHCACTSENAGLTDSPAEEFGGSVRQLVKALLDDGYPDVRTVAEIVGLSTRTVQRRLGDEDTTFTYQVEQARFEIARDLLADPGIKVADIAFGLGYADPAHFTRAFARWTGQSPRRYRQHLQQPDTAELQLH